jgi:putative transposase
VKSDWDAWNAGSIYAASRERIETRRNAFIRKWRLKHRTVVGSLQEAGDRLFTSTAAEPTAQAVVPPDAIEQLHEEFNRRIKTQTALGEFRSDAAVLGFARFRSDQHGKVDGWQTLATKPIDQPTRPRRLIR